MCNQLLIKYVSKNKTFEEVSSSILNILKKEYHRKERTLRNHVLVWNRLKQFMVVHQVECPTPDICDAFLLEISGGKDLHTLSRSEKVYLLQSSYSKISYYTVRLW